MITEDGEVVINIFQSRNLIFKSDKVELYAIYAPDFIKNITIWSSQRQLDDAHVLSLINSFKNNKFFIGTFKVVRDVNTLQSRLIDGMHRHAALSQIIGINPSFMEKVVVEVFNVDDINSRETFELFKQANNCLNLTVENSPDEKSHTIVELLCRKFPKMIIESPDIKRINRPKISKRQLYINVKQIVDTNPEKNEVEIENLILTLNSKMAEQCYDVSMTMFRSARENNFFLTLDKKWYLSIFN